MKKCILIIFCSLFFSLGAFASESKSDGMRPVEQTPHPPHDHHDTDHMKYIRREEKKTRKIKTYSS